jgi:hypothetical protein
MFAADRESTDEKLSIISSEALSMMFLMQIEKCLIHEILQI